MKNLGKTGRDQISGLKGIITAKVVYLHGSPNYLLTPMVGNDGKKNADVWIDVDRVVIVDEEDFIS